MFHLKSEKNKFRCLYLCIVLVCPSVSSVTSVVKFCSNVTSFFLPRFTVRFPFPVPFQEFPC